MTIKERVTKELNSLSEIELKQVEEYLVYLKFRARLKPLAVLEEAQLARLCDEFAEEDRQLADAGIEDFSAGLDKEDKR